MALRRGGTHLGHERCAKPRVCLPSPHPVRHTSKQQQHATQPTIAGFGEEESRPSRASAWSDLFVMGLISTQYPLRSESHHMQRLRLTTHGTTALGALHYPEPHQLRATSYTVASLAAHSNNGAATQTKQQQTRAGKQTVGTGGAATRVADQW